MRKAFTLVELLVVVVIISILAGISYGAFAAAKRRAQRQATVATIAKINSVLVGHRQDIRDRRLPLERSHLLAHIITNGWLVNPSTFHQAENEARRELTRFEQPSRWSDVLAIPVILPRRPQRAEQYEYRYNLALSRGATLEQTKANGSAEVLYLIVMQGRGTVLPIHDREWGDVDKDGLREFHDAWDRPIQFSSSVIYSGGPDQDCGTEDDNIGSDR